MRGRPREPRPAVAGFQNPKRVLQADSDEQDRTTMQPQVKLFQGRMPSGLNPCSSSTVNTRALPRHAANAPVASSSEPNEPVCRTCSFVTFPLTMPIPPPAAVVRVSVSAARRNSSSASSSRPMAMNKPRSSRNMPALIARCFTVPSLRSWASLPKRRPSCVLPIPGTPVTNAMPRKDSLVSVTSSRRSCSTASSSRRPAKWYGSSREVLLCAAKSGMGGIVLRASCGQWRLASLAAPSSC